MKNKYQCGYGHVFETEGEWHIMEVTTADKVYQFNYCPLCFGEWLAKAHPLTKVQDT